MLSIWTSLEFYWSGKELTLSQKSLVFTALQKHAFENVVGKGEYAGNQHFLFFL